VYYNYLFFSFHNQAAESKILSLNESIEYEKKKNIELEKQLNEFRAACCCKGGNEKIDTEDCSSVHDDHPHKLDQEVEYCTNIFLFSFLKIIEDSVNATSLYLISLDYHQN
jgi:hypothetical protein